MRKITAIIITLLLVTSLCFAFTTTGPNFPTTTTGNTATVGGGTRTWTTPSNANAADGVFTTVSLLPSTSDDLNCQGFGFAITSTDTINGISVEVNFKDSAGGGVATDLFAQMLKAGVATGTNKGAGTHTLTTTATTVTYGSAADLWGATWGPTDINAANFGFVWVGTSSSADTLSVDFVRITITSTPGANGKSQMLKFFSKQNVQTRYWRPS